MEDEQEKYQWHKVAESVEEIKFPSNGIAQIDVAGNKFCIISKKHILSACAQKCPHAGGKLSEGYVDALGNIVCPLHGYKFNLKSGRENTGGGYFLKIFPLELRAGGVFISFSKNKLWNWLK